MRRAFYILLLGLVAGQLAGCTIMSDMKHKIRKMNRNPPPSMDPDFMTSDMGRIAPTTVMIDVPRARRASKAG